MMEVEENTLPREKKYLKKIQNDYEEHLFDLMTTHVRDIHNKIRVHGDDNEGLRKDMLDILDKSINTLEDHLNSYNKLQTYRSMILLCNAVLVLDTSREDILDLKKRIIEDYTQSDADTHGFIPVNYQINEVRITYDVSYLSYLVEKYIAMENWNTALYCLIAVELVEPDYEKIDELKETIHSHFSDTVPAQLQTYTPIGKTLALDSNIALQMIAGKIGRFRFNIDGGHVDLRTLTEQNTVIVTSSVYHELEEYIRFKLVGVKKICRNRTDFDYSEIETCLFKRLDDVWESYGVNTDSCIPEVSAGVADFYSQYPTVLESIMDEKLQGLRISHKLRKLSHRVAMLPEAGDMALLSDVMMLGKKGHDVAIYTNDKDFTVFSKEIESSFGIEIFFP